MNILGFFCWSKHEWTLRCCHTIRDVVTPLDPFRITCSWEPEKPSDIAKTNYVYHFFFVNIQVALVWSELRHLSWFPPKSFTPTTSTMSCFVEKSTAPVIGSSQEIVPFGSITTTDPTTNLTGQKVCVVQKNPQGHVLTRPDLGKRFLLIVCVNHPWEWINVP